MVFPKMHGLWRLRGIFESYSVNVHAGTLGIAWESLPQFSRLAPCPGSDIKLLLLLLLVLIPPVEKVRDPVLVQTFITCRRKKYQRPGEPNSITYTFVSLKPPLWGLEREKVIK